MSDCVRRHSGCVVRRSRLSVFRHKPEGRDHSLRRASAGGRARAPARWRCRCGFIGCTRALDLRAVRATTGDPLHQYVALAVETARQFGRNSGSGLVPRQPLEVLFVSPPCFAGCPRCVLQCGVVQGSQYGLAAQRCQTANCPAGYRFVRDQSGMTFLRIVIPL
jgi:hypothetical protein